MGLSIGLALGALYAAALFAGVMTTAFFVGDAESKLMKAAPILTRGQQLLVLCAGIVTLAVLRALIGGLIVFLSVLFGLGALIITAYEAYSRDPARAV